MLTLLFRHDAKATHHDESERGQFDAVVFSWGKMKRTEKLSEIFKECVEVSSLKIIQQKMEFEIKLYGLDDTWMPSTMISSEDLAVALGLDPSEWTIWRLL
jgi:hypothetical protein